MRALRKVSTAQLEELAKWMETHEMLARGSQYHGSLCLWKELADRLNAMSDGVPRSTNEWRQYWSDFKFKIKRKLSAIRQYANGIGGGPSWGGNLTPIEKRILSCVSIHRTSILNDLENTDVRTEVEIGVDNSSPRSRSPHPLPQFSDVDLSPSTSCDPNPQSSDEDNHSQERGPIGPPQWIFDLENRRLREAKKRRELDERWLEEDRIWRRDILAVLNRIADALSPPPPSEFI